MSAIRDRLEQVLEREAPAWGIRPVPDDRRRLGGFDFFVLWGDLAVGLLVMLTGSLLVPGLGLPEALLAIVVGSLLGCIPLALVGLAGAREGIPGMVLFRPVLGVRGSYLPSLLNIVQLIGWTGFEFWAMSEVASRMSLRLFGHSSYWISLAAVVVFCTVLALGGPILAVRKWLGRFGAWVVLGVGCWITYRVLTTAPLAVLWHRSGSGAYPGHFWIAVDLVIAMPVSWLPLVADFNRFARRDTSGAAGTYWGYAAGNAWFYALGALLVLGAGLAEQSPAGLAAAIAALAGGWVVLLTLLVGETDEAFADIYSSAVSSQNLHDRIPQRPAIVVIALAGAAIAAWLGVRPGSATGTYESFLFLLGSVFVPLFGVFVADYFVLGNRGHDAASLFPEDRASGTEKPGSITPWRARALLPWAVGFALYQWSVPTGPAAWQDAMRGFFAGWLHLPFPLADSAMGASVPGFLGSLVVALLVLGRSPRRKEERAAAAGAASKRR